MRRIIYLAVVTLVGVVSTVATDEARQERATLAHHEVADNLYLLGNDPSVQGMGGGGNTGIFLTNDGVVLVDTKISGYGPDIMAHVREITDMPVTTIINTHTHWDHSGSNIEFPDTVDFVVHENTLAHMSRPTCDDGAGYQGGSITNCEAFKGENANYLPKTTFSNRMSLFSGSDQIDLYYFGRGHTDGDTFVVFKAARTVQTGDMFARKGLPFLDIGNSNGSAIEFGSTLQKAVDGIQGVDIVIPGHANITLTWNDFVDYSEFYNDVVTKVEQGKAAGRSVDDIVNSYSVPGQYSDFSAPENRLQSTMQYLFDGQ